MLLRQMERLVENIPTDDAQTLQRISRQDRQALSQFYDRYATVLHTTAMRILRNPKDAADILQDVFLQIWDQAGDYDPKRGSPFHWALALTRQSAIGRLQAQKRLYNFIEEVTDETTILTKPRSAGEHEFPSQAQRALIRASMEGLPLEQRQAMELAFFGGLTHNEIVQALNQPSAIIKARIRRGLLKLRENLQGVV